MSVVLNGDQMRELGNFLTGGPVGRGETLELEGNLRTDSVTLINRNGTGATTYLMDDEGDMVIVPYEEDEA